MKEEKLLNAIGKIEDEMVLEAAPQGAAQKSSMQNRKQSTSRTWIKWVAIAACLCLLVGGGVLGWKTQVRPIDEVSMLEKDYTTAQPTTEERNQDTAIDFTTTRDTSIQPEEVTINQNMTASGDELVLLDDIMQNGGLGCPDWGLTLSAKDVTPSGLTLVCTQSGGEPSGDIMTGEDYYLTVWKKGHWRMVMPVIENYGWNSLAHWITKDNDTEFKIDWKWLYGELEPGTYRLVKEFMDFRKTADYDEAIYWMEFVIE